MRKLTYFVATTIDGFIAEPGGSRPGDPSGFFLQGEHIQSIVDHYPDLLPVMAREALGVPPGLKEYDTVLEGRRSYEVGLDVGVTNAYPHLRHLVFSQTMPESPDPTVELVAGDPVATVRELKCEPGMKIYLCGGAKLAGALREEVDELVVKLQPVVACAGTPLFDADFSLAWYDLRDVRRHGNGVLFLTYTRQR